MLLLYYSVDKIRYFRGQNDQNTIFTSGKTKKMLIVFNLHYSKPCNTKMRCFLFVCLFCFLRGIFYGHHENDIVTGKFLTLFFRCYYILLIFFLPIFVIRRIMRLTWVKKKNLTWKRRLCDSWPCHTYALRNTLIDFTLKYPVHFSFTVIRLN